MGRIADYKKDYQKATAYYKKSIRLAKNDPDYIRRKLPRYLEIEAFLSYSLVMSGQVKRGYDLARNVYEKFDKEKEALQLKNNDYAVWVIWKTGIPIRTVSALIERKQTFNKPEVVNWLLEAEEDLNLGNGKLWADLKYRKAEIKNLLSGLEVVN